MKAVVLLLYEPEELIPNIGLLYDLMDVGDFTKVSGSNPLSTNSYLISIKGIIERLNYLNYFYSEELKPSYSKEFLQELIVYLEAIDVPQSFMQLIYGN